MCVFLKPIHQNGVSREELAEPIAHFRACPELPANGGNGPAVVEAVDKLVKKLAQHAGPVEISRTVTPTNLDDASKAPEFPYFEEDQGQAVAEMAHAVGNQVHLLIRSMGYHSAHVTIIRAQASEA